MRQEIRTIGPIAPAEPTDPIPLVLSLAEAKEHLEVDFDHHDAKITRLIQIAQDEIERHTSQILTPRVLEISSSAFPLAPRQLTLPVEPIRRIVSIGYTDAAGAEFDLLEADWRWSESAPRLILPAIGLHWPLTGAYHGAVRIRAEAGFDEGLAPPKLIGAMLLLISHYYEDAGALGTDLPPGVARLCTGSRRHLI